MKTNRPIIFLVVFLCFYLGVVAAAWSAEPKGTAAGKQSASPQVSAPAKATPTMNIAPQVIVTSPAEGDTWYGTETRDIQWSTIAIPEGSKIKIRFVRSDKSEYFIADNLPRSGKFSWKIDGGSFQSKQVPTGYGATTYVPVDTTGDLKVTASFEGKTLEREVPISLVIPKIRITSPQKGETWHVGKTYTVTWKNIGPVFSPVQINVQPGGGWLFLYTTNTTNSGSICSKSIAIPANPMIDNNSDFKVVVQSDLASFPAQYLVDEVAIKVVK